MAVERKEYNMGYLFTTSKDINDLDIYKFDTIMATDEEVEIARLFLLSEFDDDFVRMEKNYSEEAASYVYRRTLVTFLRYVQEWMNIAVYPGLMGQEHRPSAGEEAVMVIVTRSILPEMVSDYLEGKSSSQGYTIYQMSDEDVLSIREEFTGKEATINEDDLIAIGSDAFHVIDYESVLPVKVTDRKGFLFFCEDSEGEDYVVPYHQLFRTEEEADRLVAERNERRNSAIEQYHLVEPTDDKKLQHDRKIALEWLHYNHDIPELLAYRLNKGIKLTTAV